MVGRRNRKPAVVWLPSNPEHPVDNASNFETFIHDSAGPNGSTVTSTSHLTFDEPSELRVAAAELTSLADFEVSAYRLRRIVGKCFVNVVQLGDPTGPSVIAATAGFIVLRVDPFNGLPLSAANQYNLTRFGSERDPWVWRRTWLLANNKAPSDFAISVPEGNQEYGSVADGPHIDAKTARRISDEERLIFVATTTVIQAGSNQQAATQVRYLLDYRILASMLKSSGNRRNASR